MADSLLPRGHLQDQLTILKSAQGEPAATLALIELSSWLTGSRRWPDAGLDESDQLIINEVRHVLHDMSDLLAARMSQPACLYTDMSSIRQDLFVNPGLAEITTCSWKPGDALWTSPMVPEDSSAWLLMSELTGDAKRHSHLLVLPHPAPDKTILLGSLADADSLLNSHGESTVETWQSLHREGRSIIDFTWRCVVEAEISALLGERDPIAFPCGLGIECSLWLDPPADPIRESKIVRAKAATVHDRGWFAYGT